MCIGFITVIKKGQDLTRPGEKDDLLDIIERSQPAKEPAAAVHPRARLPLVSEPASFKSSTQASDRSVVCSDLGKRFQGRFPTFVAVDDMRKPDDIGADLDVRVGMLQNLTWRCRSFACFTSLKRTSNPYY